VTQTTPVNIGSEVAAGPWRLTLHEVVVGNDAAARVADASASNPVAPDGLVYLLARLTASNAGSRPYAIDHNDFAVTLSTGIVHRFPGTVSPEPALGGVVEPGEALEGWIVLLTEPDASGAVLRFDSATLHGDWADAHFALTEGATVSSAAERSFEVNETGRAPDAPAGPGDRVVTEDWAVELLDVVYGADVAGLFPASDYRTTALLGGDLNLAASWVGVRFQITNNRTGERLSYFPPSAFTLAEGDGGAMPDFITLTPPLPDAAGEYAPGGSRDGWVVFDVAGYGGSLLRFQPYRTDPDPRFISWSGAASIPDEPTFEGTLEPGTIVVTIEDQVRLRSAPSTDGEIIAEMPAGTELTVTGAPEEGSGFTWYPVERNDTGDSGYVAQQLIAPKA
jgi:hypothetical protein